MPLPLIGLTGYKRSGKDAFAAALTGDGWYTRVSFADPLRAAAYALDPDVGPCTLPDDLVARHHGLAAVVDALGWERAKDTVPGVRRTLERLGTDAIRSLDDGFWTRLAERAIDERTTGVIVTDVRFPNEADLIRARGGLIIRLYRPGLHPAPGAHVSETALDMYPDQLVIENGGTLDELGDKARLLAAVLARVAPFA